MISSQANKNSRRSSILKLPKPPSSSQHGSESNISSVESSPVLATTAKSTRRVSFADKKHVKEFCDSIEQGTLWDSTYEECELSQTKSSTDKSSSENITIFQSKTKYMCQNVPERNDSEFMNNKENIPSALKVSSEENTSDEEVFVHQKSLNKNCSGFSIYCDDEIQNDEKDNLNSTDHDNISMDCTLPVTNSPSDPSINENKQSTSKIVENTKHTERTPLFDNNAMEIMKIVKPGWPLATKMPNSITTSKLISLQNKTIDMAESVRASTALIPQEITSISGKPSINAETTKFFHDKSMEMTEAVPSSAFFTKSKPVGEERTQIFHNKSIERVECVPGVNYLSGTSLLSGKFQVNSGETQFFHDTSGMEMEITKAVPTIQFHSQSQSLRDKKTRVLHNESMEVTQPVPFTQIHIQSQPFNEEKTQMFHNESMQMTQAVPSTQFHAKIKQFDHEKTKVFHNECMEMTKVIPPSQPHRFNRRSSTNLCNKSMEMTACISTVSNALNLTGNAPSRRPLKPLKPVYQQSDEKTQLFIDRSLEITEAVPSGFNTSGFYLKPSSTNEKAHVLHNKSIEVSEAVSSKFIRQPIGSIGTDIERTAFFHNKSMGLTEAVPSSLHQAAMNTNRSALFPEVEVDHNYLVELTKASLKRPYSSVAEKNKSLSVTSSPNSKNSRSLVIEQRRKVSQKDLDALHRLLHKDLDEDDFVVPKETMDGNNLHEINNVTFNPSSNLINFNDDAMEITEVVPSSHEILCNKLVNNFDNLKKDDALNCSGKRALTILQQDVTPNRLYQPFEKEKIGEMVKEYQFSGIKPLESDVGTMTMSNALDLQQMEQTEVNMIENSNKSLQNSKPHELIREQSEINKENFIPLRVSSEIVKNNITAFKHIDNTKMMPIATDLNQEQSDVNIENFVPLRMSNTMVKDNTESIKNIDSMNEVISNTDLNQEQSDVNMENFVPLTMSSKIVKNNTLPLKDAKDANDVCEGMPKADSNQEQNELYLENFVPLRRSSKIVKNNTELIQNVDNTDEVMSKMDLNQEQSDLNLENFVPLRRSSKIVKNNTEIIKNVDNIDELMSKPDLNQEKSEVNLENFVPLRVSNEIVKNNTMTFKDNDNAKIIPKAIYLNQEQSEVTIENFVPLRMSSKIVKYNTLPLKDVEDVGQVTSKSGLNQEQSEVNIENFVPLRISSIIVKNNTLPLKDAKDVGEVMSTVELNQEQSEVNIENFVPLRMSSIIVKNSTLPLKNIEDVGQASSKADFNQELSDLIVENFVPLKMSSKIVKDNTLPLKDAKDVGEVMSKAELNQEQSEVNIENFVPLRISSIIVKNNTLPLKNIEDVGQVMPKADFNQELSEVNIENFVPLRMSSKIVKNNTVPSKDVDDTDKVISTESNQATTGCQTNMESTALLSYISRVGLENANNSIENLRYKTNSIVDDITYEFTKAICQRKEVLENDLLQFETPPSFVYHHSISEEFQQNEQSTEEFSKPVMPQISFDEQTRPIYLNEANHILLPVIEDEQMIENRSNANNSVVPTEKCNINENDENMLSKDSNEAMNNCKSNKDGRQLTRSNTYVIRGKRKHSIDDAEVNIADSIPNFKQKTHQSFGKQHSEINQNNVNVRSKKICTITSSENEVEMHQSVQSSSNFNNPANYHCENLHNHRLQLVKNKIYKEITESDSTVNIIKLKSNKINEKNHINNKNKAQNKIPSLWHSVSTKRIIEERKLKKDPLFRYNESRKRKREYISNFKTYDRNTCESVFSEHHSIIEKIVKTQEKYVARRNRYQEKYSSHLKKIRSTDSSKKEKDSSKEESKNTDINIAKSPYEVLEEGLHTLTKMKECIWRIYMMNPHTVCIEYYKTALLLLIHINVPNNADEFERIQEVKFISRLQNGEPAILKLTDSLIVQRIDIEKLKEECKIYEDIPGLIANVTDEINFVYNFYNDLKKLSRAYLMDICKDRISFRLRSKHCSLIIRISMNLKFFPQIRQEDIQVSCLLGSIEENDITQLMKCGKQTPNFLSMYIIRVKDLLDLLEESNLLVKKRRRRR